MGFKNKLIILSAPIAIIIEWSVFSVVTMHYRVNFDQPISAIPFFYRNLQIWFGISITIVAVLFAIFSLALRPYWKDAFKFTAVCSFIYLGAAWFLYNPIEPNTVSSVIHSGCANLATLGYVFLMFQISQRAHGLLRQASRIFFGIALIGMLGVTFSINVLHSHAAWFQLMVLLTAQAWALYTAYFLWTKPTTVTQ